MSDKKKLQASAGPDYGDRPIDRFIASVPLPVFTPPAQNAASQRFIPDAECAQSKCARPTTGCWGECSLKRNPVVFAMNAVSPTAIYIAQRDAAELAISQNLQSLGLISAPVGQGSADLTNEWPKGTPHVCGLNSEHFGVCPACERVKAGACDCMGGCPTCRANWDQGSATDAEKLQAHIAESDRKMADPLARVLAERGQGSATSGEARPALNLNAFQSYEEYAIYRAEIERLHAALAVSAEQSKTPVPRVGGNTCDLTDYSTRLIYSNGAGNLAATVAERASAPASVPEGDAILAARAEGRAEALEILTGLCAESGLEKYTGWGTSGAPEDEGSAYWEIEKLRDLFKVDDKLHNMFERAEGMYWEYLGNRDDAERMMQMVKRAPHFQPLHDFLAKHEAWDLMHDLQRAAETTPDAAPEVAQPAAQGESIDTSEFHALADAYHCANQSSLESAYDALVQHVDAYISSLATPAPTAGEASANEVMVVGHAFLTWNRAQNPPPVDGGELYIARKVLELRAAHIKATQGGKEGAA